MPGTATLTRITERAAAPDLTGVAKSQKMLVRVIAPGWGSSGYYSTEALTDAADRKVFGAGTHVYLDHPGVEERFDRPERSVRDLAGKLITDAVMESDGLYAEIEVFPHFAPIVEAMADDIGMSIRATATVEHGEAEGKSGPIIVEFDQALSVDFVTKAGAGGKIVQLLEAARDVIETTVNDQREALDALLKDAYGADKTWVWVRDFDETTVWFTVETSESFETFAQSYTTDDDGVPNALTGDRIEVRPVTQYVPVNNPAGQSKKTEESEEDTMATTQIEETALAELREKAGRVDTLVSERDAEKARADKAEADLVEANRKVAETERGKRLDEIIAEADTEFDDLQVAGLKAQAKVSEAGELDEAAFSTLVKEAAAKIAESQGAGTVRGFGKTVHTDTEVSEADLDELDDAIFGAVKEG